MKSNKSLHNSLRINIGFLINQPVGTYRDIHFDLESVAFSPEFETIHFLGAVRVGRTKTGILTQAEFQAQVLMDCVRCLESYNQFLTTNFSELFAFNKEDVTESGLILSEDGYIDLAPLAYEYLLLEIPIQPVCSPDCRGLCMVCGVNFNEGACEHMVRMMTSGTGE
jgi:uncharacterized protein